MFIVFQKVSHCFIDDVLVIIILFETRTFGLIQAIKPSIRKRSP